jgi:BioD-like phosphotransacetylase family protein
VNVAAVAALTDVACVILTESVEPDPPLLQKAQVQVINLLGTNLSTYQCAAALAKAL